MRRFLSVFLFFLSLCLFVKAQDFPQDGAIYRLVNTVRENSVLVEEYFTHKLQGGAKNTQCNDLWLFKKSGEGWNIQNVFTELYIQVETDNKNLYSTAETPTVLYVSRNNAFTTECYNFVNEKGGNWGIHCETDFDIVPWYSSSDKFDGSEWTYERVEMTEDEIAMARDRYDELFNLYSNQEKIMEVYLSYFEDSSCSQLKSEYMSMSDEELTASMVGCSNELINIALKIKNNSWAKREKEFRVHSYAPYSNPEHWDDILITHTYSWLSNPTGICANSGDVLYIFVGKEPKDGSTLEVDAITKNHAIGLRTELKKGLNVVPVVRDAQSYFIIYTADTRKEYVLSDFDSIPIHIEGGYVNGYWDKSRHTDADWVDITRNQAKHDYIFVKGSKYAYFMKRSAITASNVCPNTISDAIGWWDDMAGWQHSLMGLEDYMPSRFNNMLCGVSTEDGFMSAGVYNQNYTESCLFEILSFEKIMETSGFCWGPSHEVGHANQGAINMIGCTEASNNLFSNISVFNLGKFVTWGSGIADMAKYYEDKVPWSLQDIGIKMRMYWQLYLYYHVAGNNPQFYPALFKLLREEPLEKQGGNYHNYGRNDLLHFAEKCCEASGEDMTDFFEAWGFFVPMSNVTVDDYGSWTISSTKRMISDTKKKMAKYSKRSGAIQFIEDRVAQSLRTDGGEGYKLEYVEGKFGETGQYTAYYADSIDIMASGYVYTKTGKKLSISKGKNAVGFKVYDSDSTLITFSNVHSIELSDEMATKDLIVVAVSANGTEIAIKDKKDGTEEEQFEALSEAIISAESILQYKDNGNKNVGYYYESVLWRLTSLVDSINIVVENKDQSIHTYGEWATLVDNEISNLISNKDNRVKIHSGNIYQLYNVSYPNYSMYCESGKLTCKYGATTPKSRRFTFISTGKDNEYYISNNGNYLNFIGRSQQVTATATRQSEALKFTVGEHGLAKFYMYKSGDTDLGLHSSQQYVIVGWNHTDEPSLWRLVAIDQKKEKADVATLNSLIDEAVSIYNLIVDTLNTEAISFKEGIEVTSETLATDVATMMSKVTQSESVISKKYYEQCPNLIDELTEVISVVKAGYTVLTGINGIVYDEKNYVIYDVRGRKVENITVSGTYIVNGKKMYIKK